MKGIGKLVLAATALAIAAQGCASTPKEAKEQGFIINQSLEKTQSFAVEALTVYGFDITRQVPTNVSGHRPNKMGFFIGSGGENIAVDMQAISENKTRVHVATSKTFVGMAGQKNWDQEVQSEMQKMDTP